MASLLDLINPGIGKRIARQAWGAILRKYGLAGLAATGAAGAVAPRSKQPQSLLEM